MKIERDSGRNERLIYRPGRSLLGEGARTGAALAGQIRPGGGVAASSSDAQLLQDYAFDGDQSAFTALVEKYQSMVIGAAFRHTQNGELAREIAQEVFAALACKARTLAKHASLAGWLHRAALYESVHVLKAETRRRARNERYSSQMAVFATPRTNDSRSAESHAVIDKALNDLPNTDREALVLHYFQDLSYPEMAKTLSLSEPAVRQRVSRALQHLEIALRSHGYAGNAIVLLLTAVATQSSVAIPVGLPAAALRLAQAGSSSSLTWCLSGLVPNTAKTVALIFAAAGIALIWQTNPASQTVAAPPITPPAERYGVESSSEAKPARFASTVPETSVTMPGNPGSTFSVVTRHSETVGARARPEPAKPAQFAPPALVRQAPPRPIEPPRSGNEPLMPIPREVADAPVVLEAILENFPRLLTDLREAELIPPRAAELYTRLLTQVLSLNDSQRLRAEAFLVEHYTQLTDRGLAGPRPPNFPAADWRSERQVAVTAAVGGVAEAVGDNAPVIQTVMGLSDDVEASRAGDVLEGTVIDL